MSLFLIFHADGDAFHAQTCSLNSHFSVLTVALVKTAVATKVEAVLTGSSISVSAGGASYSALQ